MSVTPQRAKEIIDSIGGEIVVAAQLGINRRAVDQWIKKGKFPAERCPTIERMSNGNVLSEEMRPDVEFAYLRLRRRKKTPCT